MVNCVTRSTLKDYLADESSVPAKLFNNKHQSIELLKVRKKNDNDNYLWVKSEAKALKENSMHKLFSDRFEEGLRGIQHGINSKGGTKKTDKVWERIGRLKEKYASVHQYYEIAVESKGKIATGLVFEKKGLADIQNTAGLYFLRTSLNYKDESTLWAIYNAIREIESTFWCLKSDLDLRPIFHKTDEASMAHLHLGLLAYWVVSTIRYQLKNKAIHSDWREIVSIMHTRKSVTTTIEDHEGSTIQIKQCSEPTDQVKQILCNLNYTHTPYRRRKSVWHNGENFKNEIQQCQTIMDG